jgi:lipopolysaccharide/colanic/teichoic acid biosynthesis glycosyltransferase
MQRSPLVIVDLAVVLAFHELGIKLSPYGGRAVVSPYVALSLVFAIAFGAISLGLGSYDRDKRFDYGLAFRNAGIAAVLASLVNLGFHYFTLYDVVGRLTLVYGASFALIGTLSLRVALTSAVRSHPYRFTAIGGPTSLTEVLEHWDRERKQGRFYVFVAWESIFADAEHPSHGELLAADIAEIVLADRGVTDQQAIDFALISLRADVPVVDERSFYARLFERLPLDTVSKRWILEHGLARPQAVVVAAKRLADVAVAAIGLIVLSPLLLGIAIALKLTSHGPVLFIQTRQGRFFEPFQMLKFRTMRHEPAEQDTTFTRVGDHRVTRVGSVLRRFHLDELPQLLNILRGEMSLVGPRPETIEFAERMDAELPLYELRYLVRPGLTGHAQVKQGYAMDTVLDTQMKLAYDLYYMCNYSMRIDVQILLRTLFSLTRGAR